MNILLVYQDTRTGICDRIETDKGYTGTSRDQFLYDSRDLSVSNPDEKSFYILHALFVKVPSAFWMEVIPVWDYQRGWYPIADQFFA